MDPVSVEFVAAAAAAAPRMRRGHRSRPPWQTRFVVVAVVVAAGRRSIGIGIGTAGVLVVGPAAAVPLYRVAAAEAAANAVPESAAVVASWHRPKNCFRSWPAMPSRHHLPNSIPGFVAVAGPLPLAVFVEEEHTPVVADRCCCR